MGTEESDPESRRVAAVERLGLIGAENEERFDRVTRVAAQLFDVPVALITLVDDEQQWFASCIGLDIRSTARGDAFCAHAIDSGSNLFIIEDATRDHRFVENPLVTGPPYIRFYAGRVLRGGGGERIGTLCVIDTQPRSLNESQIRSLHDLAEIVEQEFALTEHRTAVVELDASERSKALLLGTMTEGLVHQDSTGQILEWNPAAERVLGLASDELGDRRSIDPQWRAVHADGSSWSGETHPAMIAIRTGRAVENTTMGVHRPDGSLVWLRVNANPIHGPSGEVEGAVTAFDDITVERELSVALQLSEEAARASLDVLEQGVVLLASDGSIRRYNPAAERLLGYSVAELEEKWRAGDWSTFDEFGMLMPDDRRPIRTAAASGEAVRGEIVAWKHKDGHLIVLSVSCIPLTGADPGMVLAFADVTAQRKMITDLARFRYLFQNANDIITVVDETGQVLYASPSNERVLGYPDGWRNPGGILGLVHPDDLGVAAREMAALLGGTRGADPFLVRVRAFDGSWRSIECVGVNLLDEPAVRGIVLTSRDATERVRLADELAHRASHDELTDLPTRRLLDSRLTDALARSVSSGERVGLCFVDLDGFKKVNDTLGHGSGDQLLLDVATKIRSAIRGNDLAARIGGDEFVVMLDPVASTEDALVAARRIRDAVLTASEGRSAITFGASVGLAVSEPADTPSSLLRRADDALYHAKATHDSSLAVADTLHGPLLDR